MAATGIVTRFAPSPTGFLHLGHACSALIAWRAARDAGGRFLLRIEDIDTTRCRPEFATAIEEDLAWLGLDWDGEVRVQSHHFTDYAGTLEALRGGGLLYPCFCTRAEIAAAAPHGPEAVYPGTCKHLTQSDAEARIAAGASHAWRLHMDRAASGRRLSFCEHGARRACDPMLFGDVVLARKDTPASYHLCVTHDDAAQGVTLVTRGEDLLPATAIHRLLQVVMGWPEPAYVHHRLLVDAAGQRLAKRDGAPAIRALREAGLSPAAVRTRAVAPR
ncbi:MAG: tRNA glutamyl-Q(34) synthetase GluQRS [Pseudomonadota bacterium]